MLVISNESRHNYLIGSLSSWMRYTEYYLPGYTRKEEQGVLTVEDCREACLQETNFICLAVAYAVVRQSCRLYDKRALSLYTDGSRSDEFNYHEYCANGKKYNLMEQLLTFLPGLL